MKNILNFFSSFINIKQTNLYYALSICYNLSGANTIGKQRNFIPKNWFMMISTDLGNCWLNKGKVFVLRRCHFKGLDYSWWCNNLKGGLIVSGDVTTSKEVTSYIKWCKTSKVNWIWWCKTSKEVNCIWIWWCNSVKGNELYLVM